MSWDKEKEKLLCERAIQGDKEALRALLTHFSAPLFSSLLLPRLGNRVEAEDVLRETMLRAVEKIGTYTWNDGGLWPWLRRIALNLIVDRGRKQQRRRKMEKGYLAEVQTLPPRIEAGAEAQLIEEQERKIMAQQLKEAMAGLNDRYRQAIELRILKQLSRQDAAEELGVSVATFDVVLHRALKSLRKSWGVVA